MATGAGPYSWAIRFVVTWLLIATFSLVLLRPLWKLTKSRPSLIIVFSRAIGNYLHLFGSMPNFIVYNIFNIPIESQSYYWAYDYCLNGYIAITALSPHVHNLALALNRSHAMFFPFHYNMVFAKKKNIYVLCLCLWLFCICVGGSSDFVYNLHIFELAPANYLRRYSMYASAVFYAALGCRMLWMRYKRSSSTISEASTEKDSVKILVVCFSCLAMSSIYQLAVVPLLEYANANFPDTARIAVYWCSYTTQWLILCTEEICLALLVRDFRRLIREQLNTVFCRGNSIETSNITMNNNNSSNTAAAAMTVVKRPIRVSQVNTTKMNNNMLGNVN